MKPNNFTSVLFAVVLLATVTPFQINKDTLPPKKISEQIQDTSVEVSSFLPSSPPGGEITPLKHASLRSDSITVSVRRINDIPAPSLEAKAAIISDLDSGEIFFEKNGSRNYSLASLTKLMTAVVSVENIGFDKIADSLRAMLIVSDNSAAESIAEAYGYEKFIALMNEKARLLDMKQTRFFDASGLSPQNQASIRDLLKLTSFIFKEHPNMFEITRETSVDSVLSTNRFAGRPDFLGGKTGFWELGVANLLSVFYYNNHRVVIVVLGSADQESRFIETEALLNWLKKAYTW